MVVNSSKIKDRRFKKKWKESGALGTFYGPLKLLEIVRIGYDLDEGIKECSIYLVPTQKKLIDRALRLDKQSPVDVAIFNRGFPEGLTAAWYANQFEEKNIPIQRFVVRSKLDSRDLEVYFEMNDLTSKYYTKNRGGICECLIHIDSSKVRKAIYRTPNLKILNK